MKILFDTHAFIWWDSEPEKLSARSSQICQEADNQLLLSVVSVWEMQIKLQLNKLTLSLPLAQLIQSQQEKNQLIILPITLPHVLAVQNLPFHHKDPFDRLLIAQAVVEGIPLLSHDPQIHKYMVDCIW